MLTIRILRDGESYNAQVSGDVDGEFNGASGDEALGYAIRELILQGYGQEIVDGGTVITTNIKLLNNS